MQQNVLVYQPEGSENWNALQWPQQRYTASGATRESAIDNFVLVWNARNNPDRTADFFRFFGPLLCAAYLKLEDTGWRAVAYADTEYTTVHFPTEEEAKAAFVPMWNDAHPDVAPITDINIDWQYDSAPE